VGAAETVSWAAGAPAETSGQPWKLTIALASRNRTTVAATSEPPVPRPARYDRVKRTV
jgi:hypothetical protein